MSSIQRAPLIAVSAIFCLHCVGPSPDSRGDSQGGSLSVDTYVTRGVVMALPDDSDGQTQMSIRHEAIDEFRSASGEIVGMDAMTMSLPIGPTASLEGIEVGDKVEFTLEISWTGSPPQQITRLSKLPPETELVFRKAAPAD